MLDSGLAATHPAARAVLIRYLADVNAHRAHAAWLREAPCNVSVPVSNGPGAPAGSEGFGGRGRWVGAHTPQIQHPIVATVQFQRIDALRIPLLARHHILAFAVRGWFRFDYTAVPWANDKHRSGYHVARIALWRCNGRWGVDPTWATAGGGELNWT